MSLAFGAQQVTRLLALAANQTEHWPNVLGTDSAPTLVMCRVKTLMSREGSSTSGAEWVLLKVRHAQWRFTLRSELLVETRVAQTDYRCQMVSVHE